MEPATEGREQTFTEITNRPTADLAICVSGFMRSFRRTAPFIETLLCKDMDADIYVSTWDILGYSHYKHSTGAEGEETITADALKKVYGKRLKAVAITKFDPVAVTPAWMRAIPFPDDVEYMKRVVSMYYHIYQAKCLRHRLENKYQHSYRCVLRLRPDIQFVMPMASWFTTIENNPKLVYTTATENYGIVNDQMMFGCPAAMDQVADIYPCILQNEVPDILPPNNCPVCPAELLLKRYLDHHAISWRELPIPYYRSLA